jgi:hypothetical protein
MLEVVLKDWVIDDGVDALFTWLLRQECQAEFFAHHSRKEAADRVGPPAGYLHYGRDGRPLLALEQRKHLSLL